MTIERQASKFSLCIPALFICLTRVSGTAAPSKSSVVSVEQLLQDWSDDDGEQEAANSLPGGRRVVGWCTYIGCSEGFACWEDYVEHYTSRHATTPGSRCPLCLQPTHQESSHRRHSWDCSKCAATFLDFLALKSHWTQFHGCNLRFKRCLPGRRLVADQDTE